MRKLFMFFIRRSITLIMGFCFAFVWTEYYSSVITNPFFRKGNWALIFLYIVLFHLFTNLYGGYRIGTERITDIVYSNWLTVCIVNALTYLQISLIGRWFQAPVPILMLTVFQIFFVVLWALFVNRIYFKMFSPKRLICLYNGDDPSLIIGRFASRPDKFDVTRSIRVHPEDYDFYRYIDGSDGIVIYNISDQKTSEILKYCVEKGIRYYLVPTLSDIILKTSDIIYLIDIPLFMSKNEGLYLGQRIIKRSFDIVVSFISLALFSPLMLIIAVLIKLFDRGPVMYTQERCTENGRQFRILKFRTMIVDAEKEGRALLASENDPRVTPLGKVLRRFRLDEMPQLINILRGDMSFVGPRPERPEIIEEYKKLVPEFDFRLNVKCGLTGYAQVLGKYNTTPEEKLKLDLIYIQTYSFLLDVKILLMTFKAVFSKESSQGI